jgi:uncharacterized heparinase superfamily protein
MTGADEILVFQRRISLGSADDWRGEGLPDLVRYNLHYFDDLTARQPQQRAAWHQALIARWIEQHPPGAGPGWEPYPLSLRIVNWIKWCFEGNVPSAALLDSLATQAQALVGQLEYHLLANHLLANAKALLFAGAFFQGPLAARWLRLGSRLYQQQIAEQILPDGGHFELSPMYHSIILEDLLDVLNLAQRYADVPELGWTARLTGTADRMLSWLRVMTHPDGQIGFFNDTALGIAIPPPRLQQYAERLGRPVAPPPSEGLTELASSGYVRMQREASVLLIDVAKVGPDYQPGHAHADTLSFEWSWGDQRVIVNSGTSCYGVSAERQWQRGTAAHSTVEVDGQNSSEVWAGFRVARRAYPGPVELRETAELLRVVASHDGYLRLPGRVLHERCWTLSADRMHIQDRLAGRYQRAVARFFLHPAVVCRSGEGGDAFEWFTSTARWHAGIIGGLPRCIPATYHPGFEFSEPNSCVESTLSQTAHELLVRWAAR